MGLKAWPCSLFNGRWCGWTPDKRLSLGLPDSSSTLLKQTKEQQNLVYFNCGVKNKPEETNCHGAMKAVLSFVTGFNCGDQSTIVSGGKDIYHRRSMEWEAPGKVFKWKWGLNSLQNSFCHIFKVYMLSFLLDLQMISLSSFQNITIIN